METLSLGAHKRNRHAVEKNAPSTHGSDSLRDEKLAHELHYTRALPCMKSRTVQDQ
jgi:hypothetical protein